MLDLRSWNCKDNFSRLCSYEFERKTTLCHVKPVPVATSMSGTECKHNFSFTFVRDRLGCPLVSVLALAVHIFELELYCDSSS